MSTVEIETQECPKILKQVPEKLVIPKYHRRIMVFDTETSGLMPKHRFGTPFPPIESYPYIMQISWILYNVATNQIEETVNEYVRIPKHVEISPESIAVHKISRELMEEKGKPIVNLLAKFFEAYMKCDCIVAHNLHFDSELVRKEMWRNRKELEKKIKIPDRVNIICGVFNKKFNAAYHIDTFCTMMNTVEFCGIVFAKKPDVSLGAEVANETSSKSTRKKFPRLNELYCKLFNDELPEDQHNSMVDVLMCLRCFLKIRSVKEMSVDDFTELIAKYSR